MTNEEAIKTCKELIDLLEKAKPLAESLVNAKVGPDQTPKILQWIMAAKDESEIILRDSEIPYSN